MTRPTPKNREQSREFDADPLSGSGASHEFDALKKKAAVSVRELAEELGLSVASTHGRIQRLVGHGLLKRGEGRLEGTYAVSARGRGVLKELAAVAERCPTCGKAY